MKLWNKMERIFFPLDFDIKHIWKQSETQPPMFGSWSNTVISFAENPRQQQSHIRCRPFPTGFSAGLIKCSANWVSSQSFEQNNFHFAFFLNKKSPPRHEHYNKFDSFPAGGKESQLSHFCRWCQPSHVVPFFNWGHLFPVCDSWSPQLTAVVLRTLGNAGIYLDGCVGICFIVCFWFPGDFYKRTENKYLSKKFLLPWILWAITHTLLLSPQTFIGPISTCSHLLFLWTLAVGRLQEVELLA